MESVLGLLMIRFKNIYMGKFNLSKELEGDWKLFWAKKLDGFSPRQIIAAMDVVDKFHDWPPTPEQLIKIIQPEEKIDYEQLYNETAIALSTSNFTPLMWHAAAKFGRYELRNGSKTPEAIRRFRDIVDALRGLPLTLPEHLSAKQLPSPGQTHNAEIAIDFLSKAKEILKEGDK